MSRLSIITQNTAQQTVEQLYKDIERRISASPSGLCPVDLASSFIKMCHSQSCGKCVPCRIGLGQLENLMEKILDGNGELSDIDLLEKTANSIYYTADCAIGYESAQMALTALKGFREDFVEHIVYNRCTCELNQPVPCVAQCPAGVDIPGYIALVEAERYADAVRLIRKDNPMPAVCGLICEHPCEVRCRRTMMDDPINIRALKKFAVDHAGNVPVPKPATATNKKVAIIGGGPAGLSCAYYLALMGHSVTIFEAKKSLGGMLRYGIPNYRLPRATLDEEIKTILSTGITVKMGVKAGENPSVKDLRKEFDAVYIAIGAHIDKKIGIEGEDADGVISAVEMLRDIGDDKYPNFDGKDIVVIGGGNVAMDVARSAIRLNAKSVKIVYRRRISDMTAMREEVDGAIAEGCEVLELCAPLRIEKNNENKAVALWIKPQIIGEFAWGRPKPTNSAQEEERLACDLVLVAIGQGIESKDFEKLGIPVRRDAIDTLQCSGVKDSDGIFAGGDCVTGPATVIRAIAGGKVAAANIDEYLGFEHIISVDVSVPPIRLDDRKSCGRVTLKERSALERVKDFDSFECGMTCEEAVQESRRCLRCDHFGFGIFKGGRNEKW